MFCFILTLVGGVGGWFANHWFSNARDRIARQHVLEDARGNRRRDFLSFMSGFRSEVERSSNTKLGEIFPDRVHQFRSETAKIRPDLSPDKQTRFDETVTALCRLTDSQVSQIEVKDGKANYIGRDLAWNAIDRVTELLD